MRELLLVGAQWGYPKERIMPNIKSVHSMDIEVKRKGLQGIRVESTQELPQAVRSII